MHQNANKWNCHIYVNFFLLLENRFTLGNKGKMRKY